MFCMYLGDVAFDATPAVFRRYAALIELNLSKLKLGVNSLDDVIVHLGADHVSVFDRTCDHNGGRLITNGERTICPLHGWEFDPATGRYLNVQCEKVALYSGPIPEDGRLNVEIPKSRRAVQGFSDSQDVSVRYLNHACVVIETPTLRIATDPWLIGSSFCNGWWLAEPSPEDSFEVVNSCDFVFISHNHPDHLHPETLSRVRKDMPILTADFSSGSTERYLRHIGFKNVIPMDFNTKLVSEETSTAISVVKSGDFRDDSGLILEAGAFTGVFSVDSNFLDFGRLPKNPTLLASSFAGGAAHFPLCFDNYDMDEKLRILDRNRRSIRTTNRSVMKSTRPKMFLPYAGAFSETAVRDKFVRGANKKNTSSDYQMICDSLGVDLLDYRDAQVFEFRGAELLAARPDGKARLQEPSPEAQIQRSEQGIQPMSPGALASYFENSGYFRPLDLEVIPTNDAFEPTGNRYQIRFSSTTRPSVEVVSGHLVPMSRRSGVNYLSIRVREKELARVLQNGLPWEDLSLGFQTRISREPNIYNSKFWFHFTNVYVNDRVHTQTEDCGGCRVLEQAIF